MSSIVDEAKDAGTPTARSDAKKRLIKNELTMGVYVADCTSVNNVVLSSLLWTTVYHISSNNPVKQGYKYLM